VPRLLCFAIPALALCAPFACKNNDTRTAPGAIASVTVNAPDTAKSGQSLTADGIRAGDAAAQDTVQLNP
jgi:hypothetical protein